MYMLGKKSTNLIGIGYLGVRVKNAS